MDYKISPINLPSKEKSRSVSDVFVSHVSSDKELIAGTLFILIEIGSKDSEDLKLIRFFLSEIPDAYYGSEKIAIREQVGGIPLSEILENALSETNSRLLKFIEAENISLLGKNISATVGVVHERNLYFSLTGKNRVLVFAKSSAEKWQAIDILDSLEKQSPSETIPDSVFFSNIISGSLPPGGAALFSNEALLEYLSRDQLMRIAVNLPPASAAEQIKNSLETVNAFVSFSGVVIKRLSAKPERPAQARSIPIISSSTSSSSIEQLNYTERATERFLSPRGAIQIQRWLKSVSSMLPSVKSINSSKLAARILRKIGIILKYIAIFLFRGLAKIFKLLSSSAKEDVHRQKHAEPKIFKKRPYAFLRIIASIKIKRLHFAYLGIAVLVLAIFFLNLQSIKKEQKKTAIESQISSTTLAIGEKLDKIEAMLLYNNEEGAKTVLDEIGGLFQILDSSGYSETTSSSTKSLKDRFDSFDEKIRHISKITNPQILADLSAIVQNISLSSFYLGEKAAIVLDNSKQYLYRIGFKDKIAMAISDPSVVPPLSLDSEDKDGNLFLAASNSILRIDGASEAITSSAFDPEKIVSKKIKRCAPYLDRLYCLFNDEPQIKRFSRTSGSYSGLADWISDGTSVAEGVDIAIDGSVYVLKNDGSAVKYLQGRVVNFSLDAINPAVKNAQRIRLSKDGNFIYITEPGKNRLIVFSGKGKYLLQYQFPSDSRISDAMASQNDKRIYYLSGSKIYFAPATHF
jgi:hypothetical protein